MKSRGRHSPLPAIDPPPDGSPDTETLRRVLGCFVTGVTVVTVRDTGGVAHGFTASSFTSVSLDPPLVLVCVGHEVERVDVYRRCSEFAINVLGDSQRALSDRFAAERPDRFAGVRWREGLRGVPILEGCIASLECASWRRIEAGDHMILVGRVLRCEDSDGRPLAYWRGSYRSLPPVSAGPAHDERGASASSMSDDDRELLCAETARLVMGWTAADIPWAYDGATPVWHTAAGDPVMTVFSWRPDRNDAQSMQVLDRMVELGFEVTTTAGGGRPVVEIDRGSMPVARAEHDDRRAALLRAALAGVGSARN